MSKARRSHSVAFSKHALTCLLTFASGISIERIGGNSGPEYGGVVGSPQIDSPAAIYTFKLIDGYLIMAAQGRGASLRAILSTEFKPYGLARIFMGGPDIILSPQFALTITLIIHELVTNAAKYGALSRPAGTLSVEWSLADRVLNLNWREAGGPPIDSPTHQGFGLRLLPRALEQFSGAVETTFEPDGFVCTMKAVLPESTSSIVPDGQPSSPAAA